jgi:DNA-binding phage protein
MKVLETEDVVRLLRSEVGRAGGQAAWANQNGVSRTVLNKVLNERGSPTKSIIRALKLRIVFVSEFEPRQPR